VKGLSGDEQTVFHVLNLQFELQSAGLRQFFLNPLTSRATALATAAALRGLGAEKSAEILEQGAALFTRSFQATKLRSWEAYLAQMDPKHQRKTLNAQLPLEDEELSHLLLPFVVNKRRSLAAERRTVPFCSEDSATLGQSPAVLR